MEQIVIDHFTKMNALKGAGIDYPIMFTIYLGIFLLCLFANIFLYLSEKGRRVVWLKDQHRVIKSRFR